MKYTDSRFYENVLKQARAYAADKPFIIQEDKERRYIRADAVASAEISYIALDVAPCPMGDGLVFLMAVQFRGATPDDPCVTRVCCIRGHKAFFDFIAAPNADAFLREHYPRECFHSDLGLDESVLAEIEAMGPVGLCSAPPCVLLSVAGASQRLMV